MEPTWKTFTSGSQDESISKLSPLYHSQSHLEYDSDNGHASVPTWGSRGISGPSMARLDQLFSSPSFDPSHPISMDSAASGASTLSVGELSGLGPGPFSINTGGGTGGGSSAVSAFFPDLSANAPQNLVSQIGFMDDTNELNAMQALIRDMDRAKAKSDLEIRIVLDGWYEAKRDKDSALGMYEQKGMYLPPETSTEAVLTEEAEILDDEYHEDEIPGENAYTADPAPVFMQTTQSIERENEVTGKRRHVKEGSWSESTASTTTSATTSAINIPQPKGSSSGNTLRFHGVSGGDGIGDHDDSLYDGHHPSQLRAISHKRSIMSRRVIASNSWPPTILASSHTTLLISIECISQQILHTPVCTLIQYPLKALEIMKRLQILMERQRRMAVGNAEAEDLLTKLVYVFAPVSRLAERLHEQQLMQEEYQRSGEMEPPSGQLSLLEPSGLHPIGGLDWSPLPSPAVPVHSGATGMMMNSNGGNLEHDSPFMFNPIAVQPSKDLPVDVTRPKMDTSSLGVVIDNSDEDDSDFEQSEQINEIARQHRGSGEQQDDIKRSRTRTQSASVVERNSTVESQQLSFSKPTSPRESRRQRTTSSPTVGSTNTVTEMSSEARNPASRLSSTRTTKDRFSAELESRLRAGTAEGVVPANCIVAEHGRAFSAGEIQIQTQRLVEEVEAEQNKTVSPPGNRISFGGTGGQSNSIDTHSTLKDYDQQADSTPEHGSSGSGTKTFSGTASLRILPSPVSKRASAPPLARSVTSAIDMMIAHSKASSGKNANSSGGSGIRPKSMISSPSPPLMEFGQSKGKEIQIQTELHQRGAFHDEMASSSLTTTAKTSKDSWTPTISEAHEKEDPQCPPSAYHRQHNSQIDWHRR
ncbi:hypothetical protein BGW41_007119 [Actinomortierella wolfii]|nr:hypothetical protein BGW41_007119 [Actinomortierella wolfii]